MTPISSRHSKNLGEELLISESRREADFRKSMAFGGVCLVKSSSVPLLRIVRIFSGDSAEDEQGFGCLPATRIPLHRDTELEPWG